MFSVSFGNKVIGFLYISVLYYNAGSPIYHGIPAGLGHFYDEQIVVFLYVGIYFEEQTEKFNAGIIHGSLSE